MGNYALTGGALVIPAAYSHMAADPSTSDPDWDGFLVTEIGSTDDADGVFQNNTNITSITFGANVTTIGALAFSGCSNLSSISIPSSVVTINHRVFMNCTNLTSITIPAGVTAIEQSTFNNTGLTSVTIPANVSTIVIAAFAYSKNLTSVTFEPATIANFGEDAFPINTGAGSSILKTAYTAGGAGTYTRTANGSDWAKEP